MGSSSVTLPDRRHAGPVRQAAATTASLARITPPDPLPQATGEKSSLPAEQPRKEPCPCARPAVPPRRSTAAPRTGRPTNLGIGRNGTPPPPLHPRHPNPIDPLHSDPDRYLRDAAAVTIPGPGIHHPIDDHRPAPAGALPARPTRPDPTAPSRQNRRAEPNPSPPGCARPKGVGQSSYQFSAPFSPGSFPVLATAWARVKGRRRGPNVWIHNEDVRMVRVAAVRKRW